VLRAWQRHLTDATGSAETGRVIDNRCYMLSNAIAVALRELCLVGCCCCLWHIISRGLQLWLGWETDVLSVPGHLTAAPDRGINQCVPCAAGQTTLLRPGQVGANSSTQCVCDAGYGTPPGALHRNVHPASAPSTRVSTAPLPPHLKIPSLPACHMHRVAVPNTHKSPGMSAACVRPTPPGLQPTAQVPLQPHPLCGTSQRTYSFTTAGPGQVTLPSGITGRHTHCQGGRRVTGSGAWMHCLVAMSSILPRWLRWCHTKLLMMVTSAAAFSGLTLYYVVGAPGAAPENNFEVYGGGGGGYSAVWINDPNQENLSSALWLLSAGGGGGGSAGPAGDGWSCWWECLRIGTLSCQLH